MRVNPNKTKALIQETAIGLFTQKGYNNISVNEIAEACGITKAGFYYHFKSKDEILSGYYDVVYQTLPDNFFEALAMSSNVEKLWYFMSLYIDFTVQNGSELLSQIIKANLDSNKGTFTVFDEKVGAICVKLIEQAQQSKEIHNPASPKNIFASIRYLIVGVAAIWCIEKGVFDEKLEIRKQFDTLLGIENT